MIRETELNLFVPSPELLVRLASGERPLGVRATPPRIRSLRETYFDTPDQALRRRGMTCKLRQEEGMEPDVVVTLGEGPDSEGVTSRSRLTASAVGFGIFETLRGDSGPAIQVRKFADPSKLRPQIVLDIQRLGRAYRRGLLRRPALLLFFDRIVAQGGGVSSVFHELRIRRRRKGGPTIKELSIHLRDCYNLFPDGLSTLQRAYRMLAMEGEVEGSDLSPYALSLAWAAFWNGRLALRQKGPHLCLPTFRGSGEDAARALSTDLLGTPDSQLIRLGTTEPRAGRTVVELWAVPDPGLTDQELAHRTNLVWFPWHELLEEVGREDLRDPVLISALLLLTRRKLMGRIPWIPPKSCDPPAPVRGQAAADATPPPCKPAPAPDLESVAALLPLLQEVENRDESLECRLRAASAFSRRLGRLFMEEVTEAKGRVLSADYHGERGRDIQLLDLVSIRVRGMLDRLSHCVIEDFVPALEEARIHLRSWSDLTTEDRLILLEDFSARYLPDMTVAPEWGPSFMPDMPPAGCAVGLMTQDSRDELTRFFHVVLGPHTPSFLPVPGTAMVLPLEEVVRGYFLHQEPELEQAEAFLFRFTTGEATVLEPAPPPEPPEAALEIQEEDAETSSALPGAKAEAEVPEAEAEAEAAKAEAAAEAAGAEAAAEAAVAEAAAPEAEAESQPEPELVERRQSIVSRVLVQHTMPESHQAQLLQALERQVWRRNPLVGWSDLYAVRGPLDLWGLEELLRLRGAGTMRKLPPP